MSTSLPDPGAGAVVTASWANESLPLSVRKELLESDLRKLGIRRAQAHGGASSDAGAASSQQQGQSSQHPQAGASGSSDTHAD